MSARAREAAPAEAAPVAGHNTLARWHRGCRCLMCRAASLEWACACAACTRLRGVAFFGVPKPRPSWWV